ncbi:hypothetical protein HY571_01385 [Candidatus Micrarchaeota archaeon]|nr:hypothetical protein [Candidatus Micrarchaeota archaeon]
MAEYVIEHERLHYDPMFSILRVKKGKNLLAECKYNPNAVVYIVGKPDKDFTKRHGRSPAMELLMHVAHHSDARPDGSVVIDYSHLSKGGKALLARLEKREEIKSVEGDFSRFVVRKVSTSLPPVEIR